MAKPTIGVLALQGDFEAHEKALARAGACAVQVRTREDLEAVDGLIIPGGESTTMLKLLRREDLFEPLRSFGETKPIFGTCAGAILLAKEVTNPAQESLGLMNIGVERNGYGRQLDSRIVRLRDGYEAVFIRALQKLAVRDPAYQTALQDNAVQAWNHRRSDGLVGTDWSSIAPDGPLQGLAAAGAVTAILAAPRQEPARLVTGNGVYEAENAKREGSNRSVLQAAAPLPINW